MTTRSVDHLACLEALPDIPRWVETRDLLLNDCDLWVGEAERRRGCFVAWDDEDEMASFVHWPEEAVPGSELLPGALEAVGRAASCCGELLGFPGSRTLLAPVLRGWSVEDVAVFGLSNGAKAPQQRGEVVTADRFLHWWDGQALRHLEADLAGELLQAVDEGAEIAVVFGESPGGDQIPVSFCYAASLSESLWDVSIDTVPSHRRKGCAQVAAWTMIDAMRRPERGAREPVWCSAASNPASAALARKLGFVQVDSIDYWTRSG